MMGTKKIDLGPKIEHLGSVKKKIGPAKRVSDVRNPTGAQIIPSKKYRRMPTASHKTETF